MQTNAFMPRGAWILGAIGFIAVTAAALWQHQPRQPVASTALLTMLLGDGAPHPVGTPAGAAHAARVAKALTDAGVAVEMHRTEIAGAGGAPIKLENVLGRLKGRTEGPATLLTAHHDSVSAGPGAGDDGSGTVTVIECARVLAQEGTERDVILLLTDGEEAGLLGAIAFAGEHPWFDDVGSVVNLDARGAAGPCHVYEVGYGQRDLVALMQSALPRPVTSSVADEIYSRMPNGSDFTVYRRLGIPGFNLAFIGDVHRYHQASDVPENLHPGTLAHMQESALALVRALDRAPPLPNGKSAEIGAWRSRMSIGDPTAMRELRRSELGTAPEPTPQSFASFGQRWMLAFDAGLAPWFTGAIALLMAFALAMAWWRGMLPCGAFWGALARLFILACAVGGAAAVAAIAMALFGQLDGRGWHQGAWPVPAWPWFAGLWAVAFAVGIALWQLIPARNAWANAASSAMLYIVLLGAVAAFIPSTAAWLLPALAVSAVAFLMAAVLPTSIARYSAAFAACVQLWALTAIFMPFEPSLIDALGFGEGAIPVIIRPLLVGVAFCVLLPGARSTVASMVATPESASLLPSHDWSSSPSSSAPSSSPFPAPLRGAAAGAEPLAPLAVEPDPSTGKPAARSEWAP